MPEAPYGSWPSPFSGASLAGKSVRLIDVVMDGDAVVWVEGRPEEGGRQAVVRWDPGHPEPEELLDLPWSARSTVHEYGGGAMTVSGGTLFFVNHADQRIWRLDVGASPVALTSTAPGVGAVRFADLEVSADGSRLACVRERHPAGEGGHGEVVNDLVTLSTGGGEPEVVAEGRDFFAAPRFSPDGELAWLTWDHPDMPWDAAELWTDRRGRVAGGGEESVSQPRWSPGGELAWISDRTGWANLYLEGSPIAPAAADFTGPDWVFGQATYAFDRNGTITAVRWENGFQRLVRLHPDGDGAAVVDTPFTAFDVIRPSAAGVVALAASGLEAPSIVRIDLPGGHVRTLRRSREDTVEAPAVSVAEPLTFATAGGASAHGFFYPPASGQWEAPEGELPPLVVTSHGGPTGSARLAFDVGIQFWTSRGLAVVDVDYRGSTGYGRDYRRALEGRWGVADVEDCIAAARHLAEEGRVDPDRLVIRGRSASGLTVLGALCSSGLFAAGACHYGVADPATLAADTHKFEARYLDRLIGPWPESADRYRDRSPLHRAEQISVPVILLHGTEDRVVPLEQAESMAAALRAQGVACALVVFEGESHGFRRAETIRRAAEAELWFYGQVLGFTPVDDIEPVPIEPPLDPTA